MKYCYKFHLHSPPSLMVILDPAQLVRIEAVHRGFMYQHLFAAGCLLAVQGSDLRAIRVELDEDIELQFHDLDGAKSGLLLNVVFEVDKLYH